MDTTEHCTGCTDDFYNGHNDIGVMRCWCLNDATLVTRYRLEYWTRPTVPGAFQEVRVLSCRREKGFVLYKALPDFAVNVVRLAKRSEV